MAVGNFFIITKIQGISKICVILNVNNILNMQKEIN